MDLLATFRVFIRVAEAGSFSAVAREFGTTQPAISRQVAALEHHLGARLIQRTTRSLGLTEDGRDLLEHARRVLDCVEQAESAVGRRHATPGGWVRLATSSTFGRLYIAPRIPRLLAHYPGLSVDLRMSDGFTDLVAEGVDLAIRVTAVQDSSLVARTIGSSRRVVVASVDCLARYGSPACPADLAGLPCIIFTNNPSPATWHFDGPGGKQAVTVDGRFRTDNGEGVRAAVLAGVGFAVLPTWFFGSELADGRLVRVLSEWEPPSVPISAIYPSRHNLASRTRAVIDFLVDEFRLDPAISGTGEA